jgi:hypothetical protein
MHTAIFWTQTVTRWTATLMGLVLLLLAAGDLVQIAWSLVTAPQIFPLDDSGTGMLMMLGRAAIYAIVAVAVVRVEPHVAAWAADVIRASAAQRRRDLAL